MTRWWWLVLLPLVAGSSCSLFETDEFICSLDNECPGTSGYGKCVLGHCAFRNDVCASGYMYDDTAGPVADTCVPPADFAPDAGPPVIDAAPVA